MLSRSKAFAKAIPCSWILCRHVPRLVSRPLPRTRKRARNFRVSGPRVALMYDRPPAFFSSASPRQASTHQTTRLPHSSTTPAFFFLHPQPRYPFRLDATAVLGMCSSCLLLTDQTILLLQQLGNSETERTYAFVLTGIPSASLDLL